MMMNVNGAQMSLNTAAGPNGLLVVFSCNTCPFVVGNGEKSDGWEGRYNETAIFAKENGVSMVLVNSNEAKLIPPHPSQGYINRGTCSQPELTSCHVLPSAYVIIF